MALENKEVDRVMVDVGYLHASTMDKAGDLLKALGRMIESVPAEFRADVFIDWEVSDWSAGGTVFYARPPTPEDVAKERAEAERLAQEAEAREKQEFARLQAKYGGKI